MDLGGICKRMDAEPYTCAASVGTSLGAMHRRNFLRVFLRRGSGGPYPHTESIRRGEVADADFTATVHLSETNIVGNDGQERQRRP
jgi:hypothetical protein